MKPDYSYQPTLEAQCYEHLLKNKGVVLAAAPGAGKTDMAIDIIARWVTDHPEDKVLVLTEGQTCLRTQFFDRLKEKPRDFGYNEVSVATDEAVHVALPHHFQRRKACGYYSLIVVDEAHHFFDASMVQRIIAANPGTKLLLLTGTPSSFIKSETYPLVAITIAELLDRGILEDPYIELVQTGMPIGVGDYNEDENLRSDFTFTTAQTEGALEKVLDALIKRLKSTDRNPDKYYQGRLKPVRRAYDKLLGTLGKTMVICHSQDQARAVASFFIKQGHPARLCISDDGAGDEAIEAFRTDIKTRILVVVRRGILGFNMPELANVVDLSMSHNPDVLFQAMCRVVRAWPEKSREKRHEKIYLKVTTAELAPLTYHVMSFTVALSQPEFYLNYNGDWKNTPVPTKGGPRSTREGSRKSEKEKKPGKKKPEGLILPELMTFTELKHVDHEVADGTHWTTYYKVRQELTGIIYNDSDNKKRQLLEMARLGKPRPKATSSLGSALVGYTSEVAEVSDPDFKIKIKAIRPQWFELKWDTKEKCEAALAQCKTRSEFRKRFSGAARAAHEMGWYKEICKKLEPVYGAAGRSREKAIVCIQTGAEYSSVTSAATALGLHQGNISMVLTGKQPFTKGFSFRYKEDKEK